MINMGDSPNDRVYIEDMNVNTQINIEVIPRHEIVFKDDTGFGAYVCIKSNDKFDDMLTETFNISGIFITPLVIGQTYHVDGIIVDYKGDKQIKVLKIWNTHPVGKSGTIAYLRTLRGLQKKAEYIYEIFGDNSIMMLKNNPIEVANRVFGIGKKSVMSWKEQLDSISEGQQTILKLLGYGLSSKESKKLYNLYKDDVVNKISENPYFLAREVKGYGFEKCDRIAKQIGISHKSKYRVQEGILNILRLSCLEGHCYLPKEEIIRRTKNLLAIRLTYSEMKNLAIKKRGNLYFKYQWGKTSEESREHSENIFNIDYKKMLKSIYDYEHEKNQDKLSSHRYIVHEIEELLIKEQLEEVNEQNRLIIDDDRVYLASMFFDEYKVAERVVLLSQKQIVFTEEEVEKVLNEVLYERNIVLEDKQREACIKFNLSIDGFFILSGSAGTGKTYLMVIILEVKKRLYKRRLKRDISEDILIFAPTGKAAKVAAQATNMECVTVHRGLGFKPGLGFEFNKDNPLAADVVIVDETSMIDVNIARYLLEAIADGTQIYFMGDVKQLPSVGAGNVLKDIIASGILDIVELDVVKRQGLLSGINELANDIIEEKMIRSKKDTNDAFVWIRETVDGCQKGVIDSVRRVLTFEGYNHDEIQVLVPQRRGPVGIYMFNYLLQNTFNKREPGEDKIMWLKFDVTVSGYTKIYELYFTIGDKVIHTENLYDMDLYSDPSCLEDYKLEKTGITNGECGRIVNISIIHSNIKGKSDTRIIIVKYGDYFVKYEDNFDGLELAWACTIHKSQGSAWKCVIVPIMVHHYKLLNNEILYTSVTRSKNFLVVIGGLKAIEYAIKTHISDKRYTYLKERIIYMYNNVA